MRVTLGLNSERTVFQVEEHVLALQAAYKDLVAKKQLLANRRKLATRRLQCASVLLTSLEGEKVWLSLASCPVLNGYWAWRTQDVTFPEGRITYLLKLSSRPVFFTEIGRHS